MVNIDNLQCYFDYIIDLLKMKFCYTVLRPVLYSLETFDSAENIL